MKDAEYALPARIEEMFRSRISFTRRSCDVWFERSTRPFARGVEAWIDAIPNRSTTRPNSVLPSPLSASFALTRKMPCRSE
jgi:hypothetical protein